MSSPKVRLCNNKPGQLVFELPLTLDMGALCRDLLAHYQIGEATRENIEDQNSQRHMDSLDMVRPPQLRWELAKGERKIKMGSGCASFTVAFSIDLTPLFAECRQPEKEVHSASTRIPQPDIHQSKPVHKRCRGPDIHHQEEEDPRQEGWKYPEKKAQQEGRERHQEDFRQSRAGLKAYRRSAAATSPRDRDNQEVSSSGAVVAAVPVPDKRIPKKIVNRRVALYPFISSAGESEKDPILTELNTLEKGISYAGLHLLVRELLGVPLRGPQSLRLTFKESGNVVPSLSDTCPRLEDLAGKVLVAQVLS